MGMTEVRLATAVDVQDASLTTADLADLAVTTAKLGNLAVTTGKLAADAVDGDKMDPAFLTQTIIAGGAAGAHTVTGIVATDSLVNVLSLANGDLTAEFTITGADTIDNTGGTATVGDFLIVSYINRT